MIKINLNKAKEISHQIRRSKREEEMKPFDDIIAKQIPGASAQQAESQREIIRKKYEKIQNKLDLCISVTELENILKQV
jgi:hypothetical protein